MERMYRFAIYLNSRQVNTIWAHTKWEALDRTYLFLIQDYSDIKRSDLFAKLLK